MTEAGMATSLLLMCPVADETDDLLSARSNLATIAGRISQNERLVSRRPACRGIAATGATDATEGSKSVMALLSFVLALSLLPNLALACPAEASKIC